MTATSQPLPSRRPTTADRRTTPSSTAANDIALLDDTDLAWVAEAIDTVVVAAGQPWRVALEHLDDTRRAEQPRGPARFAAVVSAIQRVLGGRARNAPLARTARSLVLGLPALTTADRDARITAAALELEVSPAKFELLLWSDVPRERPVELPRGRPSELEVAAIANVHLLQRAMMRAQIVNLRVHGDAGHLIHTAAARGLLTTLSLGPDRETHIDIIGPLALFHRTGVYGRALADLVPLLADCDDFQLDLLCRSRDSQLYPLTISSPVLLPAPPVRLTLPDARLVRLTKELARIAPDIAVTPRPPPRAAGATLVCPSVVLERAGRALFVELIGFWTTAYLDKKLALYRAAGVAEVVFCIDDSRACAKDALHDTIPTVRYSKHMTATARALAERLGASAPAGDTPRRAARASSTRAARP